MIKILGICLVIALLSGCSASRHISFPTEDGGVVYADKYGSGAHAVILAHGGRFTKESWKKQAEVLAGKGFLVVAIDFRGRGRSQGGDGKNDSDEYVHLDVLAAIDYLHGKGATDISVVGASFGGWAAAKAINQSNIEVDRIVLLAATVDEPATLPGRKLFILTEKDYMGEGTLRLPEIRSQFEQASEPKELVLLAGDAHAQHIFSSDQGSRLMMEIVRFLTKN